MYSTKFRAVSQDYRLALFSTGIDHIGTHHIATGKPSFRLPAINTNKCFAEMHLLDALACQRANHTFAFFWYTPPSKMTSQGASFSKCAM